MRIEMLKEIISDKVILLNTSTFMVALSQVDMIIKMIFYSVSIIYTLWMLYVKLKEVQSGRDDEKLNNQENNNERQKRI